MDARAMRHSSALIVSVAVVLLVSPAGYAQDSDPTSGDSNSTDTVGQDAVQAIAEGENTSYLRLEKADVTSDSALGSDDLADEFPVPRPSKQAATCLLDTDAYNVSGSGETLTFVLTIDADGDAEEVTRSDADGARELADCVEKDLRDLQFPSADGPSQVEVVVRYSADERLLRISASDKRSDLHLHTDETSPSEPGIAHLGARTPPPESNTSGRNPTGTLTLGKTRVVGMGDIDRVAITTILERDRNTDKLLSCYRRALKHQDATSGQIIVMFRIRKDGRVDKTQTIKDDFDETGMSSCVERGVSSSRFPKPEGGPLSVRQVFEFTRDDQERDEQ